MDLHYRQSDGAMMELDRMKGDLGNLWQRWFIQINSNPDLKSFKIIIEAMVGDPMNGDIAVDDVVFHENCHPSEPWISTSTASTKTTSHSIISSTTTGGSTTTKHDDNNNNNTTTIVLVVLAV